MPHKCTGCGTVYKDGSQSVLEGCENCDGGNSFQFVPEEAVTTVDDVDDAESDWNVVSNAGSAKQASDSKDDTAQSQARSMMPDNFRFGKSGERDSGPSEPEDESENDDIIVAEANSELDDAGEVKERLNKQFGSIKILEPGHYSLNLRKMYEDDDYIITVEEDGRYIVQSLSGWNPHNS